MANWKGVGREVETEGGGVKTIISVVIGEC